MASHGSICALLLAVSARNAGICKREPGARRRRSAVEDIVAVLQREGPDRRGDGRRDPRQAGARATRRRRPRSRRLRGAGAPRGLRVERRPAAARRAVLVRPRLRRQRGRRRQPLPLPGALRLHQAGELVGAGRRAARVHTDTSDYRSTNISFGQQRELAAFDGLPGPGLRAVHAARSRRHRPDDDRRRRARSRTRSSGRTRSTRSCGTRTSRPTASRSRADLADRGRRRLFATVAYFVELQQAQTDRDASVWGFQLGRLAEGRARGSTSARASALRLGATWRTTRTSRIAPTRDESEQPALRQPADRVRRRRAASARRAAT